MKVYVTRAMPDEGVALLTRTFNAEQLRLRIEDAPIPREELIKNIPGVSGLLCFLSDRIDAEVLDAAGPSLKIVANFAVGYDNIDIDAAAARNVYVSNTPDVLTDATADLACLLCRGAARRAGEAERFLRAGKWTGWAPRQFLGQSIHGATLGIFGMGRIGRATAARAKGFSMPVLYHDRAPLACDVEEQLGARFVDLPTLLSQSDVVSIHCPLTPDTRHAFTLNEFRQMKRTALLVNTARGPVVKEDDLAQALEEGLIFAAGIDVYEFEPDIQAALLRQERALLLPHLGSATHDARAAMARVAAENIVAALAGQRPPNCVLPPTKW